MKSYVIIGGSIAGMNCIEGIRSIDKSGKITLVTDEEIFNYGRPLISYYLWGRTDLERMRYKPADFFEKNAVEVISGVRAEKICGVEGSETEGRSVLLSDGRKLPFDALCICTGSNPFMPSFEGIETVEKRFKFTNIADALALEKAVDESSKVLVIGAGFIGLKCAEGLSERVAKITVCDLAPRVMSSILDDDASAIVTRHLQSCGIEVLLSDSVSRFEKGTGGKGGLAIMNSGKQIEFDVLVTAIGVRPNTALFKEAGGAVGKGITVGTDLRTSIDGIWAAGDCVEIPDVITGRTEVLAILPNAAMQGYCAGRNMAGAAETFDKSLRMNSIGIFGMHIMTAGNTGECVYSKVGEDGCRKLFADGGKLCGFMIIGGVAKTGIYTSLIRNRTPLEGLDLEQLAEEPSLIQFGPAYRRHKLGEPV